MFYVSKVDNKAFLFMGFDMKQLWDEREILMKEYIKWFEDNDIRDKYDIIDCNVKTPIER